MNKKTKEWLFIFIYRRFPKCLSGKLLVNKFFKREYYKFIID